jgi:hypothetical protein
MPHFNQQMAFIDPLELSDASAGIPATIQSKGNELHIQSIAVDTITSIAHMPSFPIRFDTAWLEIPLLLRLYSNYMRMDQSLPEALYRTQYYNTNMSIIDSLLFSVRKRPLGKTAASTEGTRRAPPEFEYMFKLLLITGICIFLSNRLKEDADSILHRALKSFKPRRRAPWRES